MASDFGYIEYLCDQLQGAGTITYRKMFGEYALYCEGKTHPSCPRAKCWKCIWACKTTPPGPCAALIWCWCDRGEGWCFWLEAVRVR